MDMALLLPTNSSLNPLLHQTKRSPACKVSIFVVNCYSSGRSFEVNAARTNRKLRPSFSEQIRAKWSVKIPSTRENFPWQERKHLQPQDEVEEEEEEDVERRGVSEIVSSKIEESASPIGVDQVSSSLSNPFIKAPWMHGTKPRVAQFDYQSKIIENAVVENSDSTEKEVNYSSNFGNVVDNTETLDVGFDCNVKLNDGNVTLDGETTRVRDSKNDVPSNEKHYGGGRREQITAEDSDDENGSSTELPWEREQAADNEGGGWRKKKSNTELAEKLLPEHELKRLRNISLRMFERIKVGAAGINQDLVNKIHEKWKFEEVVKLKFEEPLSCQMKRTHEMLESRTGGLVIWRSGSSVVLYRGTSYKMQRVQSFAKQNVASEVTGTNQPIISDQAKYLKDLSGEELTEFSELNQLLDELGPRFKDWCGREPYPIDADLLPGIDPEYKPPFRLFPYGVRRSLSDKEMTMFRRLARKMPPHFALGRNRELQGLAMAMIKLWEKSAIAKIAIKRGVLTTRNERMAEELRVLTGGTLLSRNKEYIVFYRGNDFLPPAVMGTLKERKQLTYLKQDEEEQARQKALTLVNSINRTPQAPLVAGTLTETVAATSRWTTQHGSADIEKMRKQESLARQASLLRNLQNRLALAKGKLTNAEKKIAKVQEHWDPSGLPTDLETISDEERLLFRKIGLSMKPYIPLGKRGVYDGTILNMHLHWKYREVVKVTVSRKSLPQVRHIAMSLETESGGILVSVEKIKSGFAIILYRGKNYQRPTELKPANLLTKRQALARAIELQRREALKHHVVELQERIELLKSEFEEETVRDKATLA